MKATRIFASLILVAATAGAAQAQFVRCSWNTCAPQVSNQSFVGPSASAYKLVISASEVRAPGIGNEVSVFLYPDVPDAWRFDDNGCQTGSQLVLSTNAFDKANCPALRGLNASNITFYGYDPASRMAQLFMQVTHDVFDPALFPNVTRWTLWLVTFDHSFSQAGPSGGGNCGGAERPLALELRSGYHYRSDGSKPALQIAPGDVNPCTWNGGPVATERSTMGRLKAQYR